MSYKPTGYPRGRPRIGEARPDNPNARAQRHYRATHREHWLEKNRAYQADWRANNPDRVAEIEKNYRRRKKLINENAGVLWVTL